MSTVLPKNVVLKFRNLTARPSDNFVEVESVRTRYSIDKETQRRTDIVEGYSIDFYSVKSGIQTVKLPESCKAIVEKIDNALTAGSVVKVNFGNPSTFRARFYALVQDGALIQGITASAETVEILSIDAPENDDDFDDIKL